MSEISNTELTIGLIDAIRQTSDNLTRDVQRSAAEKAYKQGHLNLAYRIRDWEEFNDVALSTRQRDALHAALCYEKPNVPSDLTEFYQGDW